MSINIHGKEYITVAERVKAIHEAEKTFSITTELISTDPVVVKATVTTPRGVFTGISYANVSKTLEKQSPYEVAETSAVGRALGFAGYGLVDDIATANEMVKAGVKPTKDFVEEPQDAMDFSSEISRDEKRTASTDNLATLKQKEAITKIANGAGHPIAWDEISKWTKSQASTYIREHGQGSYNKIKAEQDSFLSK